ncbi:MAG TPA: ATP-binding protein [Kofleriaceae bacterium]|nr:ATP-binding protein [Kofleriaceae bacterium]
MSALESTLVHLPSLDSATLWGAIESAAAEARFGIFIVKIDVQPPHIVYVNERAAEIVGRSRDEMIGQEPSIFLRPQDRPMVPASIARPTGAGAPPTSHELVIQRPDGQQIPISLASTRMQTAIGMLSFGYFRDVSRERDAVEALRSSEARFRLLVEAAPDGVVILRRGDIAFINPRATQMLGLEKGEDPIGRSIASFLMPADAALATQRITAMLRDGVEFPPSEYSLRESARVVEIKSIVCEWEGGPGVLAFARDVTERRAIQRRLVESDRLAALGTLAAGVAHEINNPLTYARLSAQRIERIIDTLDVPTAALATLHGHLGDINHAISRIASITQSLRTFVSRDDDAPGPVDMSMVLARSLKMVDNELRHVARLVYTPASLPPVTGNASRLEQVFVNVLINAIKALPPNPPTPHEIRVAVEHSGARVTIAITDTGIGIPPALLSRIFDPFFTTRDVGHGMGLGLSVSKTIIEKLGGEIAVESTENVGTTVRVHLPTHRASSPVVAAAVATAVPNLPRLRVLVVDDEPMICASLERMLRKEHDVSVAASGPEALGAVATTPFDVILCDVMMPGMNGDEVFHTLANRHPGFERRIVFMSGGTIGSDVLRLLDGLPNERIAKPFTVDQVLGVIAQAYGGSK